MPWVGHEHAGRGMRHELGVPGRHTMHSSELWSQQEHDGFIFHTSRPHDILMHSARLRRPAKAAAQWPRAATERPTLKSSSRSAKSSSMSSSAENGAHRRKRTPRPPRAPPPAARRTSKSPARRSAQAVPQQKEDANRARARTAQKGGRKESRKGFGGEGMVQTGAKAPRRRRPVSADEQGRGDEWAGRLAQPKPQPVPPPQPSWQGEGVGSHRPPTADRLRLLSAPRPRRPEAPVPPFDAWSERPASLPIDAERISKLAKPTDRAVQIRKLVPPTQKPPGIEIDLVRLAKLAAPVRVSAAHCTLHPLQIAACRAT